MMNAPERWQLEDGSAELSECHLVPPVTLLRTLSLAERVDVARVAQRTGVRGRAVGVSAAIEELYR